MENGISSVAVWGDSILKGAVTGYSTNRFDVFPEQSSLNIACKNLGLALTNKSVFGNILRKSRRTLERDMERGLSVDLGIIESGGNDCDLDWPPVAAAPDEPHETRTPLADFCAGLKEMIALLRAHRITPLLMTMPPLILDRWFKTITNELDEAAILHFLKGNKARLYSVHELYSKHIEKIAASCGVQLIDMRLAMLEREDLPDLMCKDGIHPNLEGYAYMATVWERELPLLHKEFE